MEDENVRAMYPWAKRLDADPGLKKKLVENMVALIPGADDEDRAGVASSIDSTLRDIIEQAESAVLT